MRGSIIKRYRKVDGRREVVFHIRYRIGSRQYSLSVGSNKKEAERILSERIAQIHYGTFSQPSRVLFSEFGKKWLEDYAITAMKPSTYRAYESVITKSVNPCLGHYAISKITPAMIQSYFAGVVRERRSTKTANNHLVLLKTMFKHARKWGYIRVSPAESVLADP